ncbi:hypothetical protein S100390_v1c07570 [Spiroplasma sp. NBRC 100390]|uniref:hypothetical protein n=1 Tax=unclassified Spiroplasma TaxID=2637901 RepID=UPI00089291E1|nr:MULTISPECIES: hypothetical protein [unclassified Spiroplasma]AOX44093.1 hypothetical protein STU14_v1c07570 [Spiroplasma sp. TU-14]APE13563.1 hypothetical protein S100390_v1c07570 [Spiroplasma sp. NBRC 100390]
MGTLLSLLGSIGIISSGAGVTVNATTNLIAETVIVDNPVEFIEEYFWDYLDFPTVLNWEEIFNTTMSTNELLETVEGGILAGSLGTAAETLGISLAIGAVIAGGYYAYHHWDSIKHFASEALKTGEHYVSSASDYLKDWWPFK